MRICCFDIEVTACWNSVKACTADARVARISHLRSFLNKLLLINKYNGRAEAVRVKKAGEAFRKCLCQECVCVMTWSRQSTRVPIKYSCVLCKPLSTRKLLARLNIIYCWSSLPPPWLGISHKCYGSARL